MKRLFFGALAALLLVAPGTAWAQPVTGVPVKSMKLTVLSTMLVGKNPSGGIGEWGFAALLEVDGRRLDRHRGRPKPFFTTRKSSASIWPRSPTSC